MKKRTSLNLFIGLLLLPLFFILCGCQSAQQDSLTTTTTSPAASADTTTTTSTTVPAGSSSTGRIIFTVISSADSSPISNASITVGGGCQTTEAYGLSTFEAVTIGNQPFTCTRAGYKDYEGVVSVSGGSTTARIISLEPSNYNVSVTGISATLNGNSATLSWNPVSDGNLAGYNLYRSTSSTGGYVRINNVLLTAANYVDGGLSYITNYYYKLTAVNNALEESNYSAKFILNIPLPADMGTPPFGTTQVKLAGGNVTVSGSSIYFTLTALDQYNNIISGIKTGNLAGKIFSTSSPASNESPVATLTFTTMTGGGQSGPLKNVAAALVLDKSGSMYFDKVASLETATRMFVNTEAAASTSNKAAVVNFDNTVELTAPMMTVDNHAALEAAINKDLSQGATALFDAIVAGVSEASKEAPSSSMVRAVVALTDGGENSSLYYHSTAEVINASVAANIPVYTVGLYSFSSEAEIVNSFTGGTYRGDLKAIAKGTTGSEDNYFEIITGVTGLNSLTDLYQKLAGALSQSYSIDATLSSALTSGNTYYLFISLQNYGSFSGNTIVIPFTTP